jgi:hypothetical protein
MGKGTIMRAAWLAGAWAWAANAQSPDPNALTRAEKDSGFVSLFDGSAIDGGVWKQWYPFRDPLRRQYYFAEQGAIVKKGNQSNNDLMIDSIYGDFILKFEFKTSQGGNSGVHYRSYLTTYASSAGIEWQILDQPQAVDNSTGAAYGIYGPNPYPWKTGQWNSGMLIANGDKVTHWLNGIKVVDYDMATQDFKNRVAASKFNGFSGKDPVDQSTVKFATNKRGYLVFQDYGLRDDMWWRGLKIARLPIKPPVGIRIAPPKRRNGYVLDILPIGFAGRDAAGRALAP